MGKPITDAMMEIYKKMEWEYESAPGDVGLIIGFPANEELGSMIWALKETKDEATVNVQFKKNVPIDARTEVLEFLNLSNCVMKFGRFFIRLSDGDVRFEVCVKKFEKVDCAELAVFLFGVVTLAMKNFIDPMGEVIAGTKTPNEAINMLSGK